MELSQVGSVQGFISEDSIDREVLEWPEAFLAMCHFVKHLGADSGGMSSQDVLASLFGLPVVAIALWSKATISVNLLDLGHIIWRHMKAICWVLDKESVMSISSWMTLWLEQSIKVPEWTFNITIGWHFLETHLEEDFSELLSDLHKRMEMPSLIWSSYSIEIKTLKLDIIISISSEHISSKLNLKFLPGGWEIRSLCDFIGFNRFDKDVLSLLVIINCLFIVVISTSVIYKFIQIFLIFINEVFNNSNNDWVFLVTLLFNPLLCNSFSFTNLGNLGTASLLHFWNVTFLLEFHLVNKLELGWTVLCIASTLIGQFNQSSFNNIKFKVFFSSKGFQNWVKVIFTNVLCCWKISRILNCIVFIKESQNFFLNFLCVCSRFLWSLFSCSLFNLFSSFSWLTSLGS